MPTGGDPVVALRETVAALAEGPAGPDLPPLTGGMVGYLGYDLVRRFERLPATAVDDLPLPGPMRSRTSLPTVSAAGR